jgi:RNA polymerase sigma-70 factor (ECF subfamily)
VTRFLVTPDLFERCPDVLALADRELVADLSRGDTRAFDRVYELLRAPLYTFLVRLSGRADIAEDLLQETWLRLARSAPELSEDTRLRPWLFTVARNLYFSHRRWSLLDATRLRELAHLPRTLSPTPFESLVASAAERQLERAIHGLPLNQREVFLLCTVEGFQPLQTAQMLGISPEAVRQRLSRARATISNGLNFSGRRFADDAGQ